MPWWAVFRQSDGALYSVGSVIASDEELSARGFGKVELAFDPRNRRDKSWNPATRVYDDVTPPKKRLRYNLLMERLTDEELLKLKGTGYIERVQGIGYVDLDDPALQSKVMSWVQAGHLTTQRAQAIFAEPD